MNVLGISWNGTHDSSAAVVCDGVLLAAAEEERFSRRKHDGRLPVNSIEFCLRHAGLAMERVDLIAFADRPFLSGRDSYLADLDSGSVKRLIAAGIATARSLEYKALLEGGGDAARARNFGLEPRVAAGLAALRGRYGSLPPIRYFDHHLGHAAATYLTSGYDRAAVVTIDAVGGPYTTVTWHADGPRITRQQFELYPNSLGGFYCDCTAYLGLGPFGEGKTMGLAGYGQASTFARAAASLLETDGAGWYRYRHQPSATITGFPARQTEPILDAPYPDFAAACQSAVTQAIRRVVDSAVRDRSEEKLCLGGGVAYNCSANGALLASAAASSIWVFPAAGDSGLSVGVALLCAAGAGEWRPGPLEHAYWGPGFDRAECEAALRREPRLRYRRPAQLTHEVARLLAAGNIVGWFQGRMELGPRALGNRSILADPRRVEVRDRVNRLKGRESWRPLAPSVLAERAAEYFELRTLSPFMLFATQVRRPKRALVPAVVHVDGTARPQTVSAEQNPRLHELLDAFARATGVPLLLNTSFNVAGEPLVCTPDDAIASYLTMELDALVLGDFVATRPDRPMSPGARVG